MVYISSCYTSDDPLSALDAKVARAVFRDAIKGRLLSPLHSLMCAHIVFFCVGACLVPPLYHPLLSLPPPLLCASTLMLFIYCCCCCFSGFLKHKTVVFVTNRVEFVTQEQCDGIVLIKNGQVAAQGPYAHMMQDEAFVDLMSMVHGQHGEEEEEGGEESKQEESVGQEDEAKAADNLEGPEGDVDKKGVRALVVAGEGKLTQKEFRSKGAISMQVVRYYGEALGGMGVMVGILCLYAFSESVSIMTNYWLKLWTAGRQASNSSKRTRLLLNDIALLPIIEKPLILWSPCALFVACVLLYVRRIWQGRGEGTRRGQFVRGLLRDLLSEHLHLAVCGGNGHDSSDRHLQRVGWHRCLPLAAQLHARRHRPGPHVLLPGHAAGPHRQQILKGTNVFPIVVQASF